MIKLDMTALQVISGGGYGAPSQTSGSIIINNTNTAGATASNVTGAGSSSKQS